MILKLLLQASAENSASHIIFGSFSADQYSAEIRLSRNFSEVIYI
jgi:hypothetical protein